MSKASMCIATIALMLFTSGCINTGGMVRTDKENKMTDRAAQRVVIEGIDEYKVCEPLFEAVRVVLSHRGAKYSPEYIQGISGAAFRMAGICPCAPTCSFAMETQELIALLGYEVELVDCEGGGWERGEKNIAGQLAKMAKNGVLPDADEIDDPDLKALGQRLQALIERTKAEVREGRAVVYWHGFTTAEFDVVCGYDNETKQLLGRGSYAGNSEEYASAPETRAIETALVGGSPKALLIGRKIREFDARAVEFAALREAVRHGRSQKNVDKLDGEQWQMLEGIACYDRWAKDFESPDHKRGMGDAYCYGIYRHTHLAAAGFLREIASNYPAATASLRKAADSFEAEAEVLKESEKLLWWDSPEGPDAARNKRAAGALQAARDHYAAGIEGIEEALAQIDREPEGDEPVAPPDKE